MSQRPLRVALAGAGMVSAHHLDAWRKIEACKIVAIADPDEAAARRRADAFGVPAIYAGVAEMLDREMPDAIDIAVPMQHHHAVAAEAARRGVAMLLQKPIAPDYAQASALVADVGTRARLMVHENWRFRPYYRRARDWIGQGRIGRPLSFRLEVESAGLLAPPEGGVPPALARQPFLATLDRLILLELLVHHLDTVRSLVGDVTVRAAMTARISPHVQGEDTALIALAGADGLMGSVFGSMALHGKTPVPTDRLMIAGSDGSIAFADSVLTCVAGDGSRAEERFDPAVAYQAAYDGAIAHFVQALRSGEPFETSASDNLKTLALVEAAYAAASSA